MDHHSPTTGPSWSLGMLRVATSADGQRAPGSPVRHLQTRTPQNGWSLFGLAKALRAQGKGADARWVEQGFAAAWARSDVELPASRF